VTFLVKWNGAFYMHKECHKILISNANGLASVWVSRFTKDQESHKKFQW